MANQSEVALAPSVEAERGKKKRAVVKEMDTRTRRYKRNARGKIVEEGGEEGSVSDAIYTLPGREKKPPRRRPMGAEIERDVTRPIRKGT